MADTRDTPHVQIIVGSVREGRMAGPVGRWIAARFEAEFGRPAEIVDLRDWALPDFDSAQSPAMGEYPQARQRAFAATIARGDAFVTISPEYNHGYTGALKNAFDWIYAEWAGKPMAFVSYGNAGGSRSVQQVKQVLGELRAFAVEPLVSLRPRDHLEGRVFTGTPEDERHLSRALAELLRHEAPLRPLRNPPQAAAWTGKRVLVVGLDPGTNAGVVAPLRAAGVAAEGLVLGASAAGDAAAPALPDGAGFDLVAIGRGAAGAVADAVRARIGKANPGTPIIDVIGSVAVRQVLAALDSTTPKLAVTEYRLDGRALTLAATGDAGRLTVTAMERTATGLAPHRVASLDLMGEVRVAVTLPVDPYSVVIDLDGVAFDHRAAFG